LGYDKSYKSGLCTTCRKIYVEDLGEKDFEEKTFEGQDDEAVDSDNDIAAGQYAYSSSKGSRKSSSNTGVYVIAGVVVGILAIAGGILVSNSRKQEKLMNEVAARNQMETVQSNILPSGAAMLPTEDSVDNSHVDNDKPTDQQDNFDVNGDGLNSEVEVYDEEAVKEQENPSDTEAKEEGYRYSLDSENKLTGGSIVFPVPSFFFDNGRKGKNDYTFIAVDDGDGQVLTEKESAVGMIFDSEKMSIEDSDAKGLLKRMTGTNAKVTDWKKRNVAGFPAIEISFTDNNGQNDIIGKGVCVTDTETGITYMTMVFYCDKITYDYTKDFDAMIDNAYER